MNRLKQIHIRGFRRLRNVKLEMRPLCVMVGANGCGKSSVLDVFSLLAASASGKLKSNLSELGGLQSVLTADGANGVPLGSIPELALDVEAEVPSGALSAAFGSAPLSFSYALAIRQFGIGYEISRELLTQQNDSAAPAPLILAEPGNVLYFEPSAQKLAQPSWTSNPLETMLSQIHGGVRNADSLRWLLKSSAYYHALSVGPPAPVRLPEQLQPANLPGTNGENLVSCLHQLHAHDRGRFEAIEDALRSAFPGFQRLDFPTVAAGMVAMVWRDENFSRPFYMNQLSEGVLRFLWLATLLQSPGLPAITLIDEPEVSLHPELLSLLAGLMREASNRTQLIVATHSDRLIRALEPKEVVTFDLQEDGTAIAAWADEHDLDEWLKDYTLDEVWRMGRMGGRA